MTECTNVVQMLSLGARLTFPHCPKILWLNSRLSKERMRIKSFQSGWHGSCIDSCRHVAGLADWSETISLFRGTIFHLGETHGKDSRRCDADGEGQ
jgi:hypothetical protein